MSSKAGRRAHEKREARQVRRAAAAGLLAIGTGAPVGAAVIVAPAADAASFAVTNNNDSGPGSLRAAIAAANAAAGADTISVGTTGVITLTSGEMEITDDVTITGPGAAQLTVNAGGHSRIFNMHAAVPTDNDAVVISGLTLTDGSAPMHYNSYYHTTYQQTGGAVVAYGGYDSGTQTSLGSLTLDHVVITNSDAASGGAVANFGTHLHLTSDTLSGNSAQNGGGAVASRGHTDIAGSAVLNNTAGRGGGIAASQATVEGTIVSGNAASSNGGGIHLYGLYGGSTVSDTLISGNTATQRGGGAYSFDDYGPVAFDNVTMVGNTAGTDAGGVFSGAGTTVTGSTISGNSAVRGGGVFSVGNGPTLQNSIIANNAATSAAANDLAIGNTYYGETMHADYSLIESAPLAGTITSSAPGSNIIGQDPQLAPLGDNGGPTQTMKPANTSPAVDQGKSFGLTTDQRGNTRPVDLGTIANASGGDGADMGAVELVSVAEGNVVVNNAVPTIGGSAMVGSTLSETSPGSWIPGGVTFARQWLRNGSAVPGATGTSYLLSAADLGARISLRVTASTPGYTSQSATSAQTSAVASAPPPPPPPATGPGTLVTTGTPVIKGRLVVGKKLTAVPPTCVPVATVTYQWLRSGKVIGTATKASYKLKRADKGKKISVRVTLSHVDYYTKVITIKHAGRVKG